jgi:DNA-binding XRE family transcriptional regulator
VPRQIVTARRTASGGESRTLADPAAFAAAYRAAGWSQGRLALVVGCHKSTIGHLATGERTTVYRSLADAIEAACAVRPGSLFPAP